MKSARWYASSEKFAIVPLTWLSSDLSLNPTDLRVAIVLSCHADQISGKCFPNLNTIAKLTGVNKRHVREALRRLEKGGIVQTEHRHRHSSVYTLSATPASPQIPPEMVWTNGYGEQRHLDLPDDVSTRTTQILLKRWMPRVAQLQSDERAKFVAIPRDDKFDSKQERLTKELEFEWYAAYNRAHKGLREKAEVSSGWVSDDGWHPFDFEKPIEMFYVWEARHEHNDGKIGSLQEYFDRQNLANPWRADDGD